MKISTKKNIIKNTRLIRRRITTTKRTRHIS